MEPKLKKESPLDWKDKVREICNHLEGKGAWSIDTGNGDWLIYLIQGQQKLMVQHDRGKLEFTGCYPADYDGRNWICPRDEPTPRMSVSAKRPAKDLAKDIERRLLDDYREMLTTAHAQIAERRQRWEDSVAIYRRVCAAAGVEPADNHRPGNDMAVRAKLGDIRVSAHGSLYINHLNSLNEANVIRLLGAYNEPIEEKQEICQVVVNDSGTMKTFEFSSQQEAIGFIRGVEWVNDSDIMVASSNPPKLVHASYILPSSEKEAA